jgi:uncharacterized protein (TIGR02600 family)
MSHVAIRRNITSTSGMVLIMVLAMLAVATLLLVALFAGARHQILGAQDDASFAREKMLADSAVALVIGQIAQASTATNQAWISQPGLLRTYSTSATRTPSACYKLYSTASLTSLVDRSGSLGFLATDVPANWSSTPNQYTDLNAPAQTAGGETIYPILDPAATNSATGVIGVSVDAPHDVEMPVAWLYQLQDGTLGPASDGTAANPIVARIAFWTDDDTCKVDINTAGCGSPWNTPRVNSTDDVAWSSNQPAAGEYSAYPGHPATTSLAEVLGTNSYSPQQTLALTPRYAWGGSQFGTQPTTNGETVPAKLDRLYASVNELRYSTNVTGGQRQTNAISASLLETERFVLTARSVSPETTLLGEPRIAIWPVADTNFISAPEMTAADGAITNDATVGAGTTNMRSYFFERHNAQSPTDDLNTNIVPANAQLFGDLVNRGNLTLPGYGTTLGAKYPGAEWTQLMLEIVDYIRSINAIDPSPAPFVPYAAGNATTGVGRGFVDPLMTTYGTGTNQITLRGIGRCPTLSSLTLVFYVCGFGFKNGTYIDYEQTPDTASGLSWQTNFPLTSTNWANVTTERIRAFAIPCTFTPACGYPEMSEACTIQIKGLNGMAMGNGTSSTNCGFASAPTSRVLSDALKVSPADRAWGGNEGPLAWRAAAIDAQQSTPFTYVFGGTNSFPITLGTIPTNKPGAGIAWPHASQIALTITSLTATVIIQDVSGNTLQTLQISFPAPSAFAVPTPTAEYSQDGSGNRVYPSYYMTLKNRVLATGTNRLFMIQPGDTSRSFEAGTDLRVLACLTNVPAAMFPAPTTYQNPNIGKSHNLHFADGTAVYGALGTNSLVPLPTYQSATTTLTWTNWCSNTITNYAWPIGPPESCPTGPPNFVSMALLGQPASSGPPGDWDTGPGFSPDGAQINLPDAGTTNPPASAYFSLAGGSVGAPTRRTPNALVPSPVIFGSLPTGINPAMPTNSTPWCTLLFALTPRRTRSIPASEMPRPRHPSRRIISCSTISGCPSSSRTRSAPAWPRPAKSISTTRSRRSLTCIAIPRCMRCSPICAFRPFPSIRPIATNRQASRWPRSGIRWMKMRPSNRSKIVSPTTASTPT